MRKKKYVATDSAGREHVRQTITRHITHALVLTVRVAKWPKPNVQVTWADSEAQADALARRLKLNKMIMNVEIIPAAKVRG